MQTKSNAAPQLLQIIHQTPFVAVEKDRLTAKYSGPGSQIQDAGSVRADAPFDAHDLMDYFEVTILSEGKKNTITVGLSSDDFVATKLPGWDLFSFGYHAGDGKKYTQGKTGKPYGPTFETNDTIGCGVYYHKKEIFFTKNGKYLGAAFVGCSLKLYPTIGMNSPGERVKVNFGQAPFVFDIATYIEDERNKLAQAIQDATPPSVYDINLLIQKYLLHAGYTETLKMFEQSICAKATTLPPHTEQRKEMIKMVQQGHVEQAILVLQKHFPLVYTQHLQAPLMFRMHGQVIIEHVRQSHIEQAMEYAQQHLSISTANSMENKEEYDRLVDTIGLIAYIFPDQSPVAYLLDMSQREELATMLNQAILKHQGFDSVSPLEKLFLQLDACKGVLQEEGTGIHSIIKL